MLKVIFAAGTALFLVNIYIQAWNIAPALLLMSFFCVPAFWLNSRGHYILSASLTLTVLLCVADYNLYVTGAFRIRVYWPIRLLLLLSAACFSANAPYLYLPSPRFGYLAMLAYLEAYGTFSPAPVSTDAGFCISVLVLLIASCGLICVVLHNTENNIAHIRQTEAELVKTYNLTLQGLAKFLEYRDSETEGHGRLVVELSSGQGEWPTAKTKLNRSRGGALIHDIGKLAIPDHILSKPGPLDHEDKKNHGKTHVLRSRNAGPDIVPPPGFRHFILSS